MKLAAHIQQSKLLYLKKSNENLSIAENNQYRWLQFDNVVQSIMLKRVPYKLTIPHQYFLVLPILFFSPKKVIELGLGGGNLVRFINHVLPDSEILSIEHSQNVIECFEQFFNPQKIQQPIVNSSFELWLTKNKNRQCDWLIYDIYQTGAEPESFIKQITRILNKTDENTWLSINLPDLDEHQLNIALLHLSSIKNNRIMHYFHIPHYKNIIIHLIPENIPLNSKESVLPQHMISRGSKLWLHGMVN